MRKWLRCLKLAVLMIAVAPTLSRADIAWWDYLEELSGPGPFNTNSSLGIAGLETAVACHVAEAQDTRVHDASSRQNLSSSETPWIFLNDRNCLLDPIREGPKRVDDYFSVRLAASATHDDRPLFSDRPNELRGKLTAWTVETRFIRRVGAPLELGASTGIIFFTGDTIDHRVIWPTVTPLSITLLPIGLLHRNKPQKYDGLVGLQFEEMAVLGGLEATDFNRSSTSGYHSSQIDFVRRFSITFDLSPFIFPR